MSKTPCSLNDGSLSEERETECSNQRKPDVVKGILQRGKNKGKHIKDLSHAQLRGHHGAPQIDQASKAEIRLEMDRKKPKKKRAARASKKPDGLFLSFSKSSSRKMVLEQLTCTKETLSEVLRLVEERESTS